MLEMIFRVPDMARTTFAISPMDQLLGGIAGASHHCVTGSVPQHRWWRRVRRQVPPQASRLLDLVNASPSGVPDFLAAGLGPGVRVLNDELDAMVALPESRIHDDLAFYGSGAGLPRIIRELRDDPSKQVRLIADGFLGLFRACLSPDWQDMQRILRVDTAHRVRTAGDVGTGPMLTQLLPQSRWISDDSLQFAAHGWNDQWDLAGQGLELRPNIFLTSVAALPPAHRSAVLFFPTRAPTAGSATPLAADGLVMLVGAARARALRAISQGPCTTTLLGERLGLSPASASMHATALRVAGAISTERCGREVRHELTPLGLQLILDNPVTSGELSCP